MNNNCIIVVFDLSESKIKFTELKPVWKSCTVCFIENFGALVGTTNVHHAIKPFLLLASHTLFHLMVHIQDK